VLDDRDDLELAQIVEQLIELLLVRTVQDQVSPENEDASCENGEHLERLEADNAIEKQVNLVHLQRAYERVVNPRERSAERIDTELVHMVADLGLIHLDQVFEEFAEADDGLWAVRDALQLAEILAENCPENKVALLFRVTDIAERRTVS